MMFKAFKQDIYLSARIARELSPWMSSDCQPSLLTWEKPSVNKPRSALFKLNFSHAAPHATKESEKVERESDWVWVWIVTDTTTAHGVFALLICIRGHIYIHFFCAKEK